MRPHTWGSCLSVSLTIGVVAGLVSAVAMTGTGLELAAGFGGVAMGLLAGLAMLRPPGEPGQDDRRAN